MTAMASGGAAGSDGSVRRPADGGDRARVSVPREEEKEGAGGSEEELHGSRGPPLDHHGGARQGGARGRQGDMGARAAQVFPCGDREKGGRVCVLPGGPTRLGDMPFSFSFSFCFLSI